MESSEAVDTLEILITLISGYPVIYDKSRNDYKNVLKKKEAWEEIATRIYTVTEKQTSVKEIKKLWERLKNEYRIERTKLKEYIPSGSGLSTDKLASDWHYFNLMGFLDKIQANRDCSESGHYTKEKDEREKAGSSKGNASSNVENDSEEDDSASSLSDDENDSPNIGIPTAYVQNEAQFSRLQKENDYFLAITDCWRRVPEQNRTKCFKKITNLINQKISDREK